MKKFYIALMAIIVVLLLTGCNYDSTPQTSDLKDVVLTQETYRVLDASPASYRHEAGRITIADEAGNIIYVRADLCTVTKDVKQFPGTYLHPRGTDRYVIDTK